MTETVEQYSEAIITIKLRRRGRGKRPKVMEARFRDPKIDFQMDCEVIPVEPLPLDTFRRVKAGRKSMILKVREQ
ncbi:hypothetical protein LCGC14_2589230 [marine sediment metagenome]|uniref:Uncharacterized protein n=1 Tax=marine sediment metagenome TaxID=412755 RepID=A0A0F9D4V4_9ZZZZ